MSGGLDIVVVIPEGLAACPVSGATLAEPSFVYRSVLDRVVDRYAECQVLLAPANRFGGPVTEQESAARYLRVHGVTNVLAPDCEDSGYIDTRGNARLLRRHLVRQGRWPLPPIILVVAYLHARRATLCFQREEFGIQRVDSVSYQVPANEKVVRRLWYYRYPTIHRVYEALALPRELSRFGPSDL